MLYFVQLAVFIVVLKINLESEICSFFKSSFLACKSYIVSYSIYVYMYIHRLINFGTRNIIYKKWKDVLERVKFPWNL